MEEVIMKKKIALLLACVMMTSVFAACGDKQATNGGEVPTLTWYMPGSKPADLELVQAEINKIIEPKIGAKLEFVYVDSGSFNEKTNMLMASQTAYDLAFSGWVNSFDRGVSQKGFLDISEYLEDHPELKEAIPDYAWEAVTLNGGIYAVPNQQIYATWPCSAVPKKYVDKYNFDASSVKKVADLEPLMEKIRDNESDVYVIDPSLKEMALADTIQILSDVYGFFVKNDDPECKVFYAYDSEAYIEQLYNLREFYNKGFIRKDIASAQGSSDTAKKAAITHGTFKPGFYADYKRNHDGEECVVFKWADPVVTGPMIRQTLTAVSATSENPDKAVALLALVNTDKELFRLIVHGIEGKHYEKLESGHIRVLDKKSYGQHTAGWYFGSQFNSYVVEGKDLDLWEQMKELNDSAIHSPLIGFAFDKTPVSNELANVTSAHTEYGGMSIGSVDPAEALDKCRDKAKLAGADKVLEEMQRQIDEFLKNK